MEEKKNTALHITQSYRSAQSPVFHTLINKQERAKLCYLHPQVCVIQSDSFRCLATGCGVGTLESLRTNPTGDLPVAYA